MPGEGNDHPAQRRARLVVEAEAAERLGNHEHAARLHELAAEAYDEAYGARDRLSDRLDETRGVAPAGKSRGMVEWLLEFTDHLRGRLDELGCHCDPVWKVLEPSWDPLDMSVPHILDVRVTHVTPCPRPHEEVLQV